MTAYKPSNFDQGFRSGKGWGGLFGARTLGSFDVALAFGFFPASVSERNRSSDATRGRSTTASRASP